MTIKLDYTEISVVVRCDECPWWYGFGFDRIHGWQVGRNHQASTHPGEEQAANALASAQRMARRIHG